MFFFLGYIGDKSISLRTSFKKLTNVISGGDFFFLLMNSFPKLHISGEFIFETWPCLP